jgi:DNA polymerase
MSEAAALLHQYLAQLAARGVTHVPLPGWVPGQTVEPLSSGAPVRSGYSHSDKPETPVAVSPPAQVKSPTSAEKAERLATLTAEATNSQSCRALGTLRDKMVFATGTPDANMMFVGEAPGAEEERLGEPFVGPAGQLLTKIIKAMGFERKDVYISNICKFRPATDDGRPQASRNRPPSRQEMDTCLPFITEEIRIVQPRVIIAVGATAANGLGIEGTVGALRGRFHDFHGTPVMVTYHPSYLLRREQEGGGLKEKRLVWEDMLQVMERLGLPISSKQRGFFLAPNG